MGTCGKVICIHIPREETLLPWCLYIPNEDRSSITYNTYLYSVITMLFSKWKNKWTINIWKMRKEDWKFKAGTPTEILCQNIKRKPLHSIICTITGIFIACLLGVAWPKHYVIYLSNFSVNNQDYGCIHRVRLVVKIKRWVQIVRMFFIFQQMSVLRQLVWGILDTTGCGQTFGHCPCNFTCPN